MSLKCAAVTEVITHMGVRCFDVIDLLQLRTCSRDRQGRGHQAQQKTRKATGQHLLFRSVSRRLVVGSAENLFSTIGQDYVCLLRQIDIWRAALDAAAGDREFVSELEGTFVPAKVFRQSVSTSQLGLPPNRLALLVRYIEHDD